MKKKKKFIRENQSMFGKWGDFLPGKDPNLSNLIYIVGGEGCCTDHCNSH